MAASLPDRGMFRTHPDLVDLADRDRGHFALTAEFVATYDVTSDPANAQFHADQYGTNLEADVFRKNDARRERLGGRLPPDPKPRTTCATCGKDVAERRDGNPVAHRREGQACRG